MRALLATELAACSQAALDCPGSAQCDVAAVGPEETTFSDDSQGAEPIGRSVSALQTTERAVLSVAGENLAESATAVFKNASGTWETIVTANNSVSTDTLHYSCTRDGYASWTYLSRNFSDMNSDPTFVYRAGPTHYLYLAYLAYSGGLKVLRTTEPCSANPVWTACTFGVSKADFPTLLWNSRTDQVWAVFGQTEDSGKLRIHVGRVGDPFCGPFSFVTWVDNVVTQDVTMPRAAISGNTIYLAFENEEANLLQFQKFDTVTGTFSGVETIGPADNTGAICTDYYSHCGDTPVLADVGHCLRADAGPEVAIASTAVGTTFVVSYSTKGTGSCANRFEQRIYRKLVTVAGSTPWTQVASTPCQTSIHTNVRFASVPGETPVAGLLQASATYHSNANGSLYQVGWRSTDNAQTWSMSYIDAGRTSSITPIITDNCYWGDYDGLTADTAHGSFFYSWGVSGTPWTIHGRAMNQ